jgi:hypothetical protein
MANNLRLVFLVIALALTLPSFSQEVDSTAQRREVEGLVSFYKYLLNTVGSKNSSARDKEVIITQSFKKAFRDDRVQIEDDLDDDRAVVTNKDVQAYLQDVDFFFEDVRFEFEDINIEYQEGDQGLHYYKVSFNSSLSGTQIDGQGITRTQERFIEINYDEVADDLKIVSVYTTKVDRMEELRLWWDRLSLSWKELFLTKVPMQDSVSDVFLQKVASIDSLDLSGGEFFLDLNPVSELRMLKYLDMSNSSIFSMEPIRSLSELTHLDASNTVIDRLDYLRYCSNLSYLDLSHTSVKEIDILANFPELKQLNMASTEVKNFEVFSQLKNLERLDVSNTAFQNSAVLMGLDRLEEVNLGNTALSQWSEVELPALLQLDLSHTLIEDLGPLSKLGSLMELNLNNTKVSSLGSLNGHASLEKIQCNDTEVSDEQAAGFMSQNLRIIVLTNADQLQEWWQSLSDHWKTALRTRAQLSTNPSQENLVRLVNTDSLDLSGENLLDGEPLARFSRLRFLDVSGNLFTNIDFASDLRLLKVFQADGLPIDDLTPLANLAELEAATIKTKTVQDIQPLSSVKSLLVLNVDENGLSDSAIVELLDTNPDLVIIYKSDTLQRWWGGLNITWKEVLSETYNLGSKPSTFDLHKMIEAEELVLENKAITDLDPTEAFIRLSSLRLLNLPIVDLCPITAQNSLKKLEVIGCPLEDIEPISLLENLQSLSVSNTSVKTLKPLKTLRMLKELDASGTNIKNLKGLAELYQLETLNLSNTRIWKLERLYEIETINTIICFNTRLRQHKVDAYKSINPDCVITYY